MGSEAVPVVRFFLIGVSVLTGFLAIATWSRRQDAPEARPFTFLVLAGMLYAFGYAGEVAQSTVPAALFWLHVEYLGLPWIPALWLLAARAQNGIKSRHPILFLVPAITFAAHFTNPWHGLFTGPMYLVHRGPFWVLTSEPRFFALLDNAYLLVAFLAGAGLYVARLRGSSELYRRQAVLMVVSSLVPFTAYFIYWAGLSPWGLDLSPFTLAISGILYYHAIFHAGVFNLSPLARAHIFNCMRDAVLIVDTQLRLVDYNHTAVALLPMLSARGIGQPIASLLSGYPQIDTALTTALTTGTASTNPHLEISLPGEAEPRSFDLQTFPLLDDGRHLGHAAILANITAQVRLREELRSFAETDALTGIANRRRFLSALELECLRTGRYGTKFSLLLIDLDRFKSVNDTFGHSAGDAVLCETVKRLLIAVRALDLPARYGGEEFTVLLPETGCEGACAVAERIRAATEETPVVFEGCSIPVSVSIGIATETGGRLSNPNSILDEADRALYRAKANGRNRVEIWTPVVM